MLVPFQRIYLCNSPVTHTPIVVKLSYTIIPAGTKGMLVLISTVLL